MSVFSNLEDSIQSIKSNKDFAKFLVRYALEKVGEDDTRNETIYSGLTGDFSMRVIYWWKDPSKAFSIRPDKNFVTVEVRDKQDNITFESKTMYED